jgi:hypothetical protein
VNTKSGKTPTRFLNPTETAKEKPSAASEADIRSLEPVALMDSVLSCNWAYRNLVNRLRFQDVFKVRLLNEVASGGVIKGRIMDAISQ